MTLKTMKLSSVEWAQHVALCVERELRRTEDPVERRRLRRTRDWHFARLEDEQVARKRQP